MHVESDSSVGSKYFLRVVLHRWFLNCKARVYVNIIGKGEKIDSAIAVSKFLCFVPLIAELAVHSIFSPGLIGPSPSQFVRRDEQEVPL